MGSTGPHSNTHSLNMERKTIDDQSMEINLEPIAIVGISCVFAGGIDTPESFWNVLKNCVDVGSEIPKERFDMDSFAPLYNSKKPLIRRGYFLNDDELHNFDPSFFGITDGEAMSMDPCHRILLEKFVHLLEDANYPIDKIKGSRTSVFIGQFTNDHLLTFHRSKVENETNLLGPNLGLYNASARISYHFDLHGPNLTLDTACSSSLQTVHLAVQSLRNGEADFAVAGASNLNYTPESFFTALIIGAISPDGRSRSYSDDANGYAKGDGVGLVLFKRLKDAIRDKDKIYCVIRDIMVSHDGNEEKSGYNVPSSYGQNLLLNEIYTRNNINLNEVLYIEGHGTGTQVGDPIEANTLGKVFKRSRYNPPLLIGSVKSVIGHTEGTAGIASLIKVALCMKHRMITPNMNFTRINPKIQIGEYNLHIVNHIVNFPDKLITVGINNFGFGGNNAHAIVTEWSEHNSNKYLSNNSNDTPILPINRINNEQNIDIISSENGMNKFPQQFILTFSTKCNQSLKNQIKKFSTWLSTIPKEFAEKSEQLFLTYLCEKILLKRTTNFSHRLSFIFSNVEELEKQIESYLSDEINSPGVILPQEKLFPHNQLNLNICFIYSGQGPQWWAMGRHLYYNEPIFRQWIEKLNSEFLSISNNSFSLIKELIEPEKEENSNIYLTNIAQPCILSIQIALTSLWLSWGIYPNMIIGHSVGEIAAAFVAGRLTLKEAVQIIYHRSRVQNYNTNKGGRMLALFLSEIETKELISGVEDRVQIAAINSPNSVTLSGDADVLEDIYNNLSTTKPKVYKSWLKIENAFHSKQMERFNIYEELIQSLSNIKGNNHNNEFDEKCSNAILYSTVTGTRTDQFNLNAEYWWKNIRNPVLFNHGIQSIFNDMKGSNVIPVFIEISPHPVLSTTIIGCFQEFKQSHKLSSIQPPISICSLKRKENEQQTILSSLCLLFSYFGSNLIDWNQFFNSRIYSQFLPNIKMNPVSKSIISFIDKLPNYTFNHQIYWYESKDSVFSRRAIKKKHHPLLGYRLWHNEAQTPTWKNVFIMNKDSINLSYLLDHKIHGDILFPASAFIELVISAINQLLQYVSLEQQSITLQNIQFLSGLHLDNDDTIQIETVIIMPFKEFFIYSRRKPANDSVRLAGISGNDVTTMYTDESFLHKYSSKEWSLNCRGLINLKIDALLMSSMFDMKSILNRLLPSNNIHSTIIAENENDIENLYQYFSECGLTFGSQFRSIKKLYRYKYEALSEITIPSTLFQEENSNKQEYICHPSVLDGCFQGMISIVPGDFFDTFVPVSIDEIILCDRKKSFVSIIEQSDTKFYATQSLNKSVKGLVSDKNFTTDILIFSETNQLPSSLTSIMILRGFKIQNYSSQNITKSIIQKVEESNSMYHNNPKKVVPVNELIEHFCAYQSWKLTEIDSNSLDVFSQSTDSEQFWIIFSDQKFDTGKQIAEILIEHQVKNENIILIYLSTINNSTNSFEQIIVNDISTISSIIRDKIQLISSLKNSTLNILFNWSIDLSMFNNTTNDFIFQSQEQIGCGTLMHIVQSIYEIKFDNDPNIFILTENAQPINNNNYYQKDYNLFQSPIIGFARSIINEYKINRMKLIDLQFSHLSINLLNVLMKELYSTINSSSNSSQNEEIVLSSYNNIIQRFVPEYSRIELSQYQNPNLIKTEIIPKLDIDRIHFQLEIPKSRQISDLQWIHNTNSRNLSPTDVEIRIHCVSISFRDMLKVRGLHPYIRGSENEYDSDQIMGADFSGIIVRKGSQVNFNLNDRVFGTITNESVFKSHIISNENNIVQAPSNLTMEQLSTLPTYLTVLYSLENRVHLQKGQTILIHTATSGVGLAFIQYAQMIGANIIATAGTEEKRAFLREKYQIKHVFNSRDLSFIPKVRQVAPNGVVDIIINSLSGIFINESLELLAPFGHFIELGKRDIYANSKLSLFPLRLNCTFHVIDLISVQKYSPETIQLLLKNISNLCQSEKLKPITPIEEFDASEIQQAFFKYSTATHIGKFVIKIAQSNEILTIENNQTEEQTQQKRKENVFPDIVCNHGTIVISGGLGGLGIDISKWMIKERGVKRIMLLSRKDINQLNHNTSQFKNWINLQQIADENNALVQVIKADVTDRQQVLSVLRSINENKSYPIRGIIHSAMVLRDSLLKNMTEDLLSEVMRPKIRGAWNLHHATVTLSCPIHFFIMFSSIRNHIPDIGQSNYNAGNNFLDSLAYWRLNYLNLPAISIGLPAISGAGYLHNNAQSTIKLMEVHGIHLMPSNYVFKMIEQLQFMQQQTSEKTNLFNPVMFVVNWKKLLQPTLSSKLVHFGQEFLKIKNENQDSTVSSNDNQQLTLDIDAITNKIRLAVAKLFGSLNVDRIDVNKPLVQQGMDSLTAVELRSWLLRDMFFNIPLVELVQGMSINDLASYIQNKSLNKQTKSNTTTNSNNTQHLSDTEMNTNENSLLNNQIKDIKQSEMSSNGTSLIIPLYHSDSKYSLFCIHDIIGLSQTFIQLASRLKEIYQNDCPSIYAFRASGYESNESFIQSIEIIAEEYIFQMKRIQPTGPYHLLGYSFGGIVAYEMVRQLYNKHQTTVQSLILIDPPIPVEQNILIPKEYDQKQFWLLRTIGLILSYFNKEINPDDIIKQILHSSLSNEERKEKIENRMQQILSILKNRFSRTRINDQISTENHEDTMAKKVFEVIHAQTIAKECYTYDLAKTSKESIKIQKAIMFTLKENNQYTPINVKHRVWTSLLSQLHIENIDGTHDKLLEIPIVHLIVDRLKEMNII